MLAYAKINWFEIYQKIESNYTYFKTSLAPTIVFYSQV